MLKLARFRLQFERIRCGILFSWTTNHRHMSFATAIWSPTFVGDRGGYHWRAMGASCQLQTLPISRDSKPQCGSPRMPSRTSYPSPRPRRNSRSPMKRMISLSTVHRVDSLTWCLNRIQAGSMSSILKTLGAMQVMRSSRRLQTTCRCTPSVKSPVLIMHAISRLGWLILRCPI